MRAALLILLLILSTGVASCRFDTRPAAISTAVGHVIPNADGSIPTHTFLSAPTQTVEVDRQRSATFLAGNIAFLVAAVAVFLALWNPVLTKTMWTLAIVAAGYGAFAITFATYYTYIVFGLFALLVLAVLVGLLLLAKHTLAAKTSAVLADAYEHLADQVAPAQVLKAKTTAAVAQASHGIQTLVNKLRGK